MFSPFTALLLCFVCFSVVIDGVCLSSNKRITYLLIRKIIKPSFLRKRMVGGGRPLVPEILGQRAPVGANSPIFNG